MNWEVMIPVIVAIITSGVAIWKTYVNRALEHRLTVLEERQVSLMENLISQEERECLSELRIKVALIWKVIERDGLKGMINDCNGD